MPAGRELPSGRPDARGCPLHRCGTQDLLTLPNASFLRTPGNTKSKLSTSQAVRRAVLYSEKMMTYKTVSRQIPSGLESHHTEEPILRSIMCLAEFFE